MACPEVVTLHNGAKMPIIGFGTWQILNADAEVAVDKALEAGYRHFDTATMYENEAEIGKVTSSWISTGKLKRDDLFLVTKLPNVGFRAKDVEKWLRRSLEKLQTEYVDLYLIHSPAGFLERGEELFPVAPDGSMLLDLTTDHISLWKALEAQVDAGRAKAIGLSNFNQKQVQRILDNCRIKPANLQVELQVYLQEKQLVEFCNKNGISVTAYSPLGSPGSAPHFLGPSRSPACRAKLEHLLSNPTVMNIAEKHKKTPAQILLRHIIQKGISAIPKTVTPERMAENIQVFDFILSPVDMSKLNALDLGDDGRIFVFHHFIKGLEKHPENPYPERIVAPSKLH